MSGSTSRDVKIFMAPAIRPGVRFVRYDTNLIRSLGCATNLKFYPLHPERTDVMCEFTFHYYRVI